MDIEILDSWKEFDTNYALVKTSCGIFTISRGQTSYAVEQAVERFSVIPSMQTECFILWTTLLTVKKACIKLH